MKDFTPTIYKKLLKGFLIARYSFQTLQDFIHQPEDKAVILRHDVDRKPGNALVIAKIENEAGIKASYYFRIVKVSYYENIIRQIAEMGHEIGYHYENLSEISKEDRKWERGKRIEKKVTRKEEKDFFWKARMNRMIRMVGWKQLNVEREEEFRDELFEFALDDFILNLEKLRELYPVKTICMHGSPLSKWDNRDLWKKYDYRDYGIIAEPYFDLDFDEIFYVTDTGRKWNNSGASIRERVDSRFDIEIKSTYHFIELIKQDLISDKIMINTHPQRWTDSPLPWVKELIGQNVKNVIKKLLVRMDG